MNNAFGVVRLQRESAFSQFFPAAGRVHWRLVVFDYCFAIDLYRHLPPAVNSLTADYADIIGRRLSLARGAVAHVFYVGDTQPFKNFELKVDVMTDGGIYFRTAYQEKGFPRAGIECQVNVSHTDWIKTGSLYGLAHFGLTPAKDNQWWTQHIIVRGEAEMQRRAKVTCRGFGTLRMRH